MLQKNSDITIREQLSSEFLTRIENPGNSTVPETIPEKQVLSQQKNSSLFQGCRIIQQMPSVSNQADIFIVEKDNEQYILKLYHYGIEPKREILQTVKTLGEKYPDEFIRVHETDFDPESKRWYEIQEYAKFGSLQNIINNSSTLTPEQRNWLFSRTAYEVGKALNILHSNNILHLDMKPSNILVRSMRPFNLVLIDFGIASTLSSDLSKKFTQTRGTPMYQSPESWVGSMGRASDWWGLGMILLEIASGSHPFNGLNQNVIASIIATRPIEIPGLIDSGQRELLRGLLTRDPGNRWKWEQIARWLKGERGIGDKFEDAAVQLESSRTKSDVKPFTFMGKKCTSLEEFSREVVLNEDAWEKGKIFLTRGYIRKWLEENRDFDASIEIDNMLSGIQDTDEKLFFLIQKFGNNLPFVFCGHVITFKNLFISAAKELRRGEMTTMERKIAASVDNGTLLRLVGEFHGEITPEIEVMPAVLTKLAGRSWDCQTEFFEFYASPEKFYCPFADVSDIKNVVEMSAGMHKVPITLSEWHNLESNYFIPEDIAIKIQTSSGYTSAVNELISMKDSGRLLSKFLFTDREAEFIRTKLLSLIKPEHHTLEFINFYIHSKDYYCPFAGMKDFISETEKLSSPPEFLSEWKNLEEKYILPIELVDKTLHAETYNEAVSKISLMASEGMLIPVDTDKKIQNLARKCRTLEEYISLHQKLNQKLTGRS